MRRSQATSRPSRAHAPGLDLGDGEVVERLDAVAFERGAQGARQFAAAGVPARMVGTQNCNPRLHALLFEPAREREGRLVDRYFKVKRRLRETSVT